MPPSTQTTLCGTGAPANAPVYWSASASVPNGRFSCAAARRVVRTVSVATNRPRATRVERLAMSSEARKVRTSVSRYVQLTEFAFAIHRRECWTKITENSMTVAPSRRWGLEAGHARRLRRAHREPLRGRRQRVQRGAATHSTTKPRCGRTSRCRCGPLLKEVRRSAREYRNWSCRRRVRSRRCRWTAGSRSVPTSSSARLALRRRPLISRRSWTARCAPVTASSSSGSR